VIELRGWQSVVARGQVDDSSASGRTMIHGGDAIDARTLTASTRLDTSYDHVRIDTTAGDILVTLPPARTMPGRGLTIERVDSSTNTVTIRSVNDETLDGRWFRRLSGPLSTLRLYSTGENWERE
jgi:hypothetical protein